MTVSMTRDDKGREIGSIKTPAGTKYLNSAHVYIRASDGEVFVSGTPLGGLDPDKAEIAKEFELVKGVRRAPRRGEPRGMREPAPQAAPAPEKPDPMSGSGAPTPTTEPEAPSGT